MKKKYTYINAHIYIGIYICAVIKKKKEDIESNIDEIQQVSDTHRHTPNCDKMKIQV